MRSNTCRLLIMLLVASVFAPTVTSGAQDKQKTRPRTVGQPQSPQPPAPVNDKINERLEPDDTSGPPRSDVPADTLANRQQSMSEEDAQLVPYYNNYLSSYRLGPEDVISVSVFGLDRYSKAGIIVPPDGTVALPLIPEGVFVVGKTTKQVADEVKQKLDEYVIEPKVMVSLEKAQSAVFWVVGDVGQPGIRAMTRRVTVSEAVALAGGVLPTGDKKKVTVLRRKADGYPQPTRIDLAAIERGRAPDTFYLNPGDQVVVPGNKFKSIQKVMSVLPVLSFFRIFTGGF